MRALAIYISFALTLLLGGSDICAAAESQDVVAIDVLLLPDAVMAQRVRAVNHRLLQDSPAGFALDATHVPHLMLLQCYVRRADLDAVTASVDAVLRRAQPAGMELAAAGYFASSIAGVSATGILVRATPTLAGLHRDIVVAVTPYMRHGGTAAAFVDAPHSATIQWTADYVDRFIPNSSGPNFSPHVTAGVAHSDFVARMIAGAFEPFTFKIAGAGIYQLGDIGTARKQLWVWP